MSASFTIRWSDAEILAMLDLRDEGKSYSGIARALAEMGFQQRTRNSVAGILFRLARDEQVSA